MHVEVESSTTAASFLHIMKNGEMEMVDLECNQPFLGFALLDWVLSGLEPFFGIYNSIQFQCLKKKNIGNSHFNE